MAVDLVKDIEVMVLAIVIAVLVMMFTSKFISYFIDNYSTVKILALSFLILIGFTFLAEGLGMHVTKVYIYMAMVFSVGVESINIIAKKNNS